MKYCILILSILFSSGSYAMESRVKNNDFILSFGGSAALPTGFYSKYLNPGFSAEIFVSVPLFNLLPGLMIEGGAGFSSWNMIHSPDSRLSSFSLIAGAAYYFKIIPYLEPFTGLYYTGSYFAFNGNSTGKADNFFKSFLSLRAGFVFPFNNGLDLKTGVEYFLSSFSDQLYEQISFFGVVTFNFSGYKRYRNTLKKTDLNSLIEIYTETAVMKYQEKKFEESEKMFNKIREIEPENQTAKEYIRKIEAEKKYQMAQVKLKENKVYDAIVLLNEAADYIPEAKESLKSTRRNLFPKVKNMERIGIDAFENQNFDSCIEIMNNILLIDPQNNTANIYLPRALKRRQAFKSLE